MICRQTSDLGGNDSILLRVLKVARQWNWATGRCVGVEYRATELYRHANTIERPFLGGGVADFKMRPDVVKNLNLTSVRLNAQPPLHPKCSFLHAIYYCTMLTELLDSKWAAKIWWIRAIKTVPATKSPHTIHLLQSIPTHNEALVIAELYVSFGKPILRLEFDCSKPQSF